jgi:metal-responsive CopG/Arc/MetJ family transcriptional regulator
MAKQQKRRGSVPQPDIVPVTAYVPQAIVDEIDGVAQVETRKRAQMMRVLIEEALAARAAKEQPVA